MSPLLPAPLSSIAGLGGVFPPLQGTLIFLCGGDEGLFERVKSTIEGTLGKAAHFFGPVGAGSKMKLIVNMTMGTMMNSLVSATRKLSPGDTHARP